MQKLQEKELKKNSPIHGITPEYSNVTAEGVRENMGDIELDIRWLTSCMEKRFLMIQNDEDDIRSLHDIEPLPELAGSNYLSLLNEFNFDYAERAALVLAFIAMFVPATYTSLLQQIEQDASMVVKTGFIYNRVTRHYLPTFHTLLFLLSGSDLSKRAYYSIVLERKNPLFKEGIIELARLEPGGTESEMLLVLNPGYSHYLRYGSRVQLDYSPNFPATLLTTDKTFDDLVLSDSVREELAGPINFVKYQEELYRKKEAFRKISPGYVVMFYGGPGTGKTLTASVIGKELGVDVYRVQLSRVISKYIGETEKNLEMIFDRLEGKNCILFFDEADALLGKRTEINDAKDRYANQEVSYLLQRIEQWNGLIILATNFEQNLDKAFERRILTKIYYKSPEYNERLKLWKTLLPASFRYETAELETGLAQAYKFSGGMIAKIIKLACIKAVSTGSDTITMEILSPFIKKECFLNNIPFN